MINRKMRWIGRNLVKWLPWRRSLVLVPLSVCIIILQLFIIIRMDRGENRWLEPTQPGVHMRTVAYLPEDAWNSSYHSRSYLGHEQDNPYNWVNCTCGLHFRVDAQKALMFPVPTPHHNKFLTIGIPTVKRQGDNYIVQTVTSLLSNMDDDQRRDVTIVILVADFEPSLRIATFVQLQQNFEQDIKDGRIHVIQTPGDLYATFKVTKQTYGQSINYVTWRSKQNYDYAYLMRYSAPLAQYYMQLEDDVTTARNFVDHVREYITKQNESWTCLEFSELGFIGKLYRSEDLERLSQLLLMFFQEQPVDVTYLYFNMLMTQLQKRLRTPTLFQHKGTKSSLPGKIQPLKDRFFDNMEKKYKGDNPPAEVYTTLKTYLNFVPKLPYTHGEGYFWSNGSPGVGDSYLLVFDEPMSIDRIIVETGSESHPEDTLQHGKLLVSLTLVRNTDRLDCTNDIDLGEFKDGRIEVKDVESKVMFKVMCLQIKVLQEQTPWLLIREIAVFLTPAG